MWLMHIHYHSQRTGPVCAVSRGQKPGPSPEPTQHLRLCAVLFKDQSWSLLPRGYGVQHVASLSRLPRHTGTQRSLVGIIWIHMRKTIRA